MNTGSKPVGSSTKKSSEGKSSINQLRIISLIHNYNENFSLDGSKSLKFQ
jgi:hypothetical protein